MRKVLVLLGFVAFAAPAWADDAPPARLSDVSGDVVLIYSEVIGPPENPAVLEEDAELSDGWTASGENSAQAGPFPCYCVNNNGRARCLRDEFCNESPPCVNGACPQGMACWVDSCCGEPLCFPDDCIQDPACQQPGTCGTFEQCSDEPPSGLTFYRDPREFALAAERAGKQLKCTENFEGSNLPPNSVVGFDDPLQGGVPNGPYPTGLACRNLLVQSNLLGGAPVNPSPRGLQGLAAASAPFFGVTSDIVVSNTFVDSHDLIFSDECCKTAVGGNTLDLLGPGAVTIRVYSAGNVFLGQADFPADAAGTNFMGVISDGPCIGRINVFSNGGAEGLDNVQMWCVGDEDFFCEAVANKVKKAKNCQGPCPPLPPQKTNRLCDPPGPNPADCPPGLKAKGSVKGPCPGNPTGCKYKKFKLNGVCDP